MSDKLKTIDIKGKEYVKVNERIIFFREKYKDHKLITKMISLENGVCIFKAEALNEKNEVVATGHAYEKEDSSFINKTSYIENCETSAVGRALGNFGIGIDTSIASAEEAGNAIANQSERPKLTRDKISEVVKYLKNSKGEWEFIEKKYFVDDKIKSEIMDIIDND